MSASSVYEQVLMNICDRLGLGDLPWNSSLSDIDTYLRTHNTLSIKKLQVNELECQNDCKYEVYQFAPDNYNDSSKVFGESKDQVVDWLRNRSSLPSSENNNSINLNNVNQVANLNYDSRFLLSDSPVSIKSCSRIGDLLLVLVRKEDPNNGDNPNQVPNQSANSDSLNNPASPLEPLVVGFDQANSKPMQNDNVFIVSDQANNSNQFDVVDSSTNAKTGNVNHFSFSEPDLSSAGLSAFQKWNQFRSSNTCFDDITLTGDAKISVNVVDAYSLDFTAVGSAHPLSNVLNGNKVSVSGFVPGTWEPLTNYKNDGISFKLEQGETKFCESKAESKTESKLDDASDLALKNKSGNPVVVSLVSVVSNKGQATEDRVYYNRELANKNLDGSDATTEAYLSTGENDMVGDLVVKIASTKPAANFSTNLDRASPAVLPVWKYTPPGSGEKDMLNLEGSLNNNMSLSSYGVLDKVFLVEHNKTDPVLTKDSAILNPSAITAQNNKIVESTNSGSLSQDVLLEQKVGSGFYNVSYPSSMNNLSIDKLCYSERNNTTKHVNDLTQWNPYLDPSLIADANKLSVFNADKEYEIGCLKRMNMFEQKQGNSLDASKIELRKPDNSLFLTTPSPNDESVLFSNNHYVINLKSVSPPAPNENLDIAFIDSKLTPTSSTKLYDSLNSSWNSGNMNRGLKVGGAITNSANQKIVKIKYQSLDSINFIQKDNDYNGQNRLRSGLRITNVVFAGPATGPGIYGKVVFNPSLSFGGIEIDDQIGDKKLEFSLKDRGGQPPGVWLKVKQTINVSIVDLTSFYHDGTQDLSLYTALNDVIRIPAHINGYIGYFYVSYTRETATAAAAAAPLQTAAATASVFTTAVNDLAAAAAAARNAADTATATAFVAAADATNANNNLLLTQSLPFYNIHGHPNNTLYNNALNDKAAADATLAAANDALDAANDALDAANDVVDAVAAARNAADASANADAYANDLALKDAAAKAAADAALTAANAALTAANNAKDTANTALTNANAALTNANNLKNAAVSVLATAIAEKNTADNTLNAANDVKDRADTDLNANATALALFNAKVNADAEVTIARAKYNTALATNDPIAISTAAGELNVAENNRNIANNALNGNASALTLANAKVLADAAVAAAAAAVVNKNNEAATAAADVAAKDAAVALAAAAAKDAADAADNAKNAADAAFADAAAAETAKDTADGALNAANSAAINAANKAAAAYNDATNAAINAANKAAAAAAAGVGTLSYNYQVLVANALVAATNAATDAAAATLANNAVIVGYAKYRMKFDTNNLYKELVAKVYISQNKIANFGSLLPAYLDIKNGLTFSEQRDILSNSLVDLTEENSTIYSTRLTTFTSDEDAKATDFSSRCMSTLRSGNQTLMNVGLNSDILMEVNHNDEFIVILGSIKKVNVSINELRLNSNLLVPYNKTPTTQPPTTQQLDNSYLTSLGNMFTELSNVVLAPVDVDITISNGKSSIMVDLGQTGKIYIPFSEEEKNNNIVVDIRTTSLPSINENDKTKIYFYGKNVCLATSRYLSNQPASSLAANSFPDQAKYFDWLRDTNSGTSGNNSSGVKYVNVGVDDLVVRKGTNIDYLPLWNGSSVVVRPVNYSVFNNGALSWLTLPLSSPLESSTSDSIGKVSFLYKRGYGLNSNRNKVNLSLASDKIKVYVCNSNNVNVDNAIESEEYAAYKDRYINLKFKVGANSVNTGGSIKVNFKHCEDKLANVSFIYKTNSVSVKYFQTGKEEEKDLLRSSSQDYFDSSLLITFPDIAPATGRDGAGNLFYGKIYNLYPCTNENRNYRIEVSRDVLKAKGKKLNKLVNNQYVAGVVEPNHIEHVPSDWLFKVDNSSKKSYNAEKTGLLSNNEGVVKLVPPSLSLKLNENSNHSCLVHSDVSPVLNLTNVSSPACDYSSASFLLSSLYDCRVQINVNPLSLAKDSKHVVKFRTDKVKIVSKDAVAGPYPSSFPADMADKYGTMLFDSSNQPVASVPLASSISCRQYYQKPYNNSFYYNPLPKDNLVFSFCSAAGLFNKVDSNQNDLGKLTFSIFGGDFNVNLYEKDRNSGGQLTLVGSKQGIPLGKDYLPKKHPDANNNEYVLLLDDDVNASTPEVSSGISLLINSQSLARVKEYDPNQGLVLYISSRAPLKVKNNTLNGQVTSSSNNPCFLASSQLVYMDSLANVNHSVSTQNVTSDNISVLGSIKSLPHNL